MWQDLYIDEVLSGCASVQQTQLLQQEISCPLLDAGFPLQKWSLTSEEFLATIRQDLQETWHSLKLEKERNVAVCMYVHTWAPYT